MLPIMPPSETHEATDLDVAAGDRSLQETKWTPFATFVFAALVVLGLAAAAVLLFSG